MKQPNTEEPNNLHALVEDLTVNQEQAAEVKGGPIEIRELHIKVNVNE